MSGMIMVQSQAEEKLLLDLVTEFASKVVLPRLSTPTETFKKYAEKGVYGIVGVEVDDKTHESLFQIQLPPSYLGYIEYEVRKLRDFVAANEVRNPGKNILL
jgi:hypothetical protein